MPSLGDRSDGRPAGGGRWLAAPRRGFRAAAARVPSLGFALLLFLSLLGAGRLDPRNVDWTLANQDRAQKSLAWCFLRDEPWRLPLTWTDRIFPPEGTSAAFLGVNPLAAVPLKAAQRWLPRPFQYNGAWMLLSLLLTSWAAFEICSLLTERPLDRVLGSCLITLSPPLLNQMQGHEGLTAHWVILFSLWLYLSRVSARRPGDPRGALVAQWGLALLAAAITPYLAVQVLVLAVAFAGGLAIDGRLRPSLAAAFSALVGLSVFGVFALVGFLPSRDPAAYTGGLYGKASLNLVGLINPALPGSPVLPRIAVAFPQQERDAGYHYLGLGALILLLLALPLLGHRRPGLWRRHLPLALAALVLAALAISPTITLGPRVLAELPLPPALLRVGSTFRASGRLFWPVGYLLVIAGLRALWRTFPPRFATLLLAALTLVQAFDTAGVRARVHRSVTRTRSAPLRSAEWRQPGPRGGRLEVLPSLGCGAGTPGGSKRFAELGWVACRAGMSINSFYVPRRTPSQVRRLCHDDVADLLAGRGEDDTTYVLNAALATAVRLRPATRLRCRPADGLWLCTAGARAAPRPDPWPLPIVPAGAELRGDELGRTLLYGWSEDATLRRDRALLAFAGAPATTTAVTLRLRALQGCLPLSVHASAGAGAVEWSPAEPGEVDLVVPARADAEGRILVDLDLRQRVGVAGEHRWPWSIAPRLELVALQVEAAPAPVTSAGAATTLPAAVPDVAGRPGHPPRAAPRSR